MSARSVYSSPFLAIACAIGLAACKPEAKPTHSPSPEPPALSEPSATPTPTLPPTPVPDVERVSPRTFVHYETGFQGPPGYGRWRWQGHDPARTGNDGLPVLAAARHPTIGVYDSGDEAVIGYHLLLMKGAGFDGAVVRWNRGDEAGEAALRALFAKAHAWDEQHGLAFGLLLLVDLGAYADQPTARRPETLGADLDRLLGDFAASPVYQQLEGLPVLALQPRPDPRRANQPSLTPAELGRARKLVQRAFRLAYQDPGPGWQGVVDLPFGWPEPRGGENDDGGSYLDWYYANFAALRARGWELPLAIGVAFPGFDDRGVYSWTRDPGRRRVVARTIEGQPTLARSWQHVLDYNQAHPDDRVVWMQTVSWNGWNEGTEIEPSVERGSIDFENAAKWNQRFSGLRNNPGDALAVANAYLAARRAGKTDTDFARVLDLFSAGDMQGARQALPRP